ncbi:MAG TPA: S8 family serine peptidase [Myxococcales bacterium]
MSLLVLMTLARRADAVPNVTQAIDGLPQVIAPQQLIVSCNPLTLGLCTTALNAVGAVVIATGLSAFDLAVLPAGASLQNVLDTLRISSAIASVEPNRILIGSASYPQTWHFPAIDAPGDATLLPGSHSPPLVAVLDTGVAYENFGAYRRAPVFDRTAFAPGWDFVHGDAHPNDDNGHGTAMATIIAGRGRFSSAGIPYVGPAQGVTIQPVKVLDANNQGTEFWLAEGIRYAVESGAQVINLSLDFARNYVPGAAMREALAAARHANVVVVAASGNTGRRVLYPAAFPDVISVGAVRLDASSGYVVTGYSAFGEALDLVGPGGVSDQDVNHDGLWDGVLAQAFPPGAPAQISWWLFAGTSPATAHVSAAAAALIGNGVGPHAVRPLLQRTAAKSSSGNNSSGWDPSWGSGRVQASKAISKASGFTPPQPLYADAIAALRLDGRAAGAVTIATASGAPVSNVEVHIRWRGAASASQTATTDSKGIARFVSPAPTSSRKLFLIEVPRVIYQGAAQRPRAFARQGGGFGSLALTLNLSPGGPPSSTDGLGIWGYGYAGGVGLGSGTTGSGLGSGTTGSTGDGDPSATYPLTTGIQACPLTFPLYSYSTLSLTASSAFFSGALLSTGYSVRAIDSSMVLAPGAAALDLRELAAICGIGLLQAKSLSTGYFSSGNLYVAGVGPPPPTLGIGDNFRFWSEVMSAERSTAP